MSSQPNLKALGLHEGRNHTLCTCGACAHRLRIIAARMGITMPALVAMLNAPTPEPVAARVVRPRSGGQVASRATVTVNGNQYVGADAILAAVRALL